VKEALFLIRNGVNVYDEGILQPAPWLLTIFSLFEGLFTNFYTIRLLFIIFDLLLASALYELSSSKYIKNCPLKSEEVVKCYLYNPLGWFAVFGMNWGLLIGWLQLTALILAQMQKGTAAAILTGFLIHVDFYNLALVAPIALSFKSSSKKVATKCLAIWLILTFSSSLLVSRVFKIEVDNHFVISMIDSVYLSRMRIDSLRPNSGMTWYLFSQVFPAFTSLIKVTFQMVLIVFWPACALKFRSDPIFMFLSLIGSQMILKGYPSVADYVLFFGLLMTQARLFEQTRILFIALFVAAGVYVLKMQIWRYWIELPGFNANFYYIFTLIWNAVLIIIYVDLMAAYNKTKIYEDNPKLKEKVYEKFKIFQR
jgi:hypothetical protein